MQLSQKRKIFCNLLLNFLNLDSIFNICKKKMTLIRDVFLNLRTPKDMLRYISKQSPLRGRFENLQSKRAETLLKSERQHLYHIYWSLWRQFSWKKSLWVISKILEMFVNPLTADNKYSLLNKDNLFQHFEMPLSQKGKICLFFFFFNFLNLHSILNIFEKKMTLKADVFLNLRTLKKVVT